jgi:hypothetical protein
MRRRSLITLIASAAATLAAGSAEAQLPSQEYRWALPDWRATWSGGPLSDDRGFAIEAADGAVYVAGVSGAGDGGGDLLLQRRNLDGSLAWSRTWGGRELDQAQGMALAGDAIWVVAPRPARATGSRNPSYCATPATARSRTS